MHNFYEKLAPIITRNGQQMRGPLPDLILYYDGPLKEIQVQEHEAGRVDLIAWRYMQSRDPLYARAIKIYNGIADGLTEPKINDYLYIPVRANLDDFLARVYNRG